MIYGFTKNQASKRTNNVEEIPAKISPIMLRVSQVLTGCCSIVSMHTV